jgi:hypothetical protein
LGAIINYIIKGPIVQRIRAHGYKPQCREFKSLLVEYQGELEVSAMGSLKAMS